MRPPIKLVVVGGGTAGWMFAAAAARQCPHHQYKIELIESNDIGTIGVGEASQPQLKRFNDRLGISETEMLQSTQASFKLGIQFQGWGELSSDYIHPFGTFGDRPNSALFTQHWLRVSQNPDTESLFNYSFAVEACRAGCFELPSKDQNNIRSTYTYGYHFDAGQYVELLKSKFNGKGVKRVEGKIVASQLSAETGNIEKLRLESGEEVYGDYFIDCSGLNALLIYGEMRSSFENWSHWLPCNKAIAVPCEASNSQLTPYTRSSAREVGWQWRIPLQHRLGNGYVYCDDFISDEHAEALLMSSLEGEPLASPKRFQFTTGYRPEPWVKNCIAIGLSGGFIEPLESTSIYLIQIAIERFLANVPSYEVSQAAIDEFNRILSIEYSRVRDFLILHYHLNNRPEAFWRHCREMSIPNELALLINSFRKRGFVETHKFGAFPPTSWISVLMGQGAYPKAYNRILDSSDDMQVIRKLRGIRHDIVREVSNMQSHSDFITDFCKGNAGD